MPEPTEAGLLDDVPGVIRGACFAVSAVRAVQRLKLIIFAPGGMDRSSGHAHMGRAS